MIVVIRGGGARNELATFDAEPIARAIAAAPVPVLTGLGHEIDRSVADEVAHTSLKTPTACAQSLVQAVGQYLTAAERRYAAVVGSRATALATVERALGDRAHRIARRTHAAVERADERLGVRVHRLRAGAHRPLADGERRRRRRRPSGWSSRAPQLLAAEERHLGSIEARVRSLDPVNVLARGWSITRAADGRVVRSPADVAAGDDPHHPARGRLAAQPRRARRQGQPVNTTPASPPPDHPGTPRPSTSSTASSASSRAATSTSTASPTGSPGPPS